MRIQQSLRFVANSIVLMTLVVTGRPGFARDKYETIDAQAYGTGTQTGQNIGVTLNIYEFSTPATNRSRGSPSNRDKIRALKCSPEDERRSRSMITARPEITAVRWETLLRSPRTSANQRSRQQTRRRLYRSHSPAHDFETPSSEPLPGRWPDQ